MKRIGILNGPNLDRLGKREPHIYGKQTLADLEQILTDDAVSLGVQLEFFQSNHEGAILDKTGEWSDIPVYGVVMNPGALAHTSIALRDAIAGNEVPFIEVHLTNIYKREPFRHLSLTAPLCVGMIMGFGIEGYRTALSMLAKASKS